MEEALTKAKRSAGCVRDFSRGALNPRMCAKQGWKKIVLPKILYGLEIANLKDKDMKNLEREQ